MGDRPLLASDGVTLVVAEGSEVFAFAVVDDRELWRRDLGEPIVGVGHAHGDVHVLGRSGRLRRMETATGRLVATVATRMTDAVALATSAARSAVVSRLGVAEVVDGAVARIVDVPGATCAAYGPRDVLAVGTREALVLVGARKPTTLPLPAPAAAVAWSPAWWVVAAGGKVLLVRDLDSAIETFVDLEGIELSELAASADGSLLAARAADRVVLFALRRRFLIGKVSWFDALPGGLALRASEPRLVVAVTGGNANLLDLGTGMIRRTDPAPGRPRGSWALLPEIDAQRLEVALSANPVPAPAAASPASAQRPSFWWVVAAFVVAYAIMRLAALQFPD